MRAKLAGPDPPAADGGDAGATPPDAGTEGCGLPVCKTSVDPDATQECAMAMAMMEAPIARVMG
jgi:hypothetical protein